MGRALRVGRAATFLVVLSEGAVWGLGFGYILLGAFDFGPAIGTVTGITAAATVAGWALYWTEESGG